MLIVHGEDEIMPMIYKMFSKSMPGLKYQDKGWECQDFSGDKQFGITQAIAVADGHGSSECFRSQIGAKKAIEVAFKCVENFCLDSCNFSNIEKSSVKFSDVGIANFKFALSKAWREEVYRDWQERAASLEQEVRFKDLEEKYKSNISAKTIDDLGPYLYEAYGTTLLLAVSIGTQLLLIQIGDGTCVILQKNGKFRIPIPRDENNRLNFTVSLCEEDAHLKMRHVVLDCDPRFDDAPVAVFLSSDGLDNCFPVFNNEENLYRVYTAVIEGILSIGFDGITSDLINWLPQISKKVSKDDISLAFFVSDDKTLLKDTLDLINCAYKPNKVTTKNSNSTTVVNERDSVKCERSISRVDTNISKDQIAKSSVATIKTECQSGNTEIPSYNILFINNYYLCSNSDNK